MELKDEISWSHTIDSGRVSVEEDDVPFNDKALQYSRDVARRKFGGLKLILGRFYEF